MHGGMRCERMKSERTRRRGRQAGLSGTSRRRGRRHLDLALLGADGHVLGGEHEGGGERVAAGEGAHALARLDAPDLRLAVRGREQHALVGAHRQRARLVAVAAQGHAGHHLGGASLLELTGVHAQRIAAVGD